MGSQITNVLRCLYLEASGYQVTVTELVGWEHSMKNELIIARYTGQLVYRPWLRCAFRRWRTMGFLIDSWSFFQENLCVNFLWQR
jgi:hypothetical protein